MRRRSDDEFIKKDTAIGVGDDGDLIWASLDASSVVYKGDPLDTEEIEEVNPYESYDTGSVVIVGDVPFVFDTGSTVINNVADGPGVVDASSVVINTSSVIINASSSEVGDMDDPYVFDTGSVVYTGDPLELKEESTEARQEEAQEYEQPMVFRKSAGPLKEYSAKDFAMQVKLESEAEAKFSHDMYIGKRDKVSAKNTYYIKEMASKRGDVVAQREVFAKEVMRLFIPYYPKAKLISKQNGGFVATRAVPGAVNMLDLFRADAKMQPRDRAVKGVRTNLLSGNYKGLGRMVVMAAFLCEKDLKFGNIVLDGNNRLISIDHDQSLQQTGQTHEPVDPISEATIKQLPYAYTDGKVSNWLDEVLEGKPNDKQGNMLAAGLVNNQHFRNEVNEQILKLLICPDYIMSEMVDLHYSDIMESIDVASFLEKRREMILEAALKNESFQAFVQTDRASDIAAKFLEDIQAFKPAGGAEVLKLSEAECQDIAKKFFEIQEQAKLGPQACLERRLNQPLILGDPMPVINMRAIVAAEKAKQVKQGSDFNCYVIEVDNIKDGKLINHELIKQLMQKQINSPHEKRVQVIAKSGAHYTAIDFNFSREGNSFTVIDAASDPREQQYFEALRDVRINDNPSSPPVFKNCYMVSAQDSKMFLQKDQMSCPGFAIDVAVKMSQMKDFYKYLQNAHADQRNGFAKLNTKEGINLVDWTMMPPNFVINAQSRSVIKNYLEARQKDPALDDLLPGSKISFRDAMTKLAEGDSQAVINRIGEVFSGFQRAGAEFVGELSGENLIQELNNATQPHLGVDQQPGLTRERDAQMAASSSGMFATSKKQAEDKKSVEQDEQDSKLRNSSSGGRF